MRVSWSGHVPSDWPVPSTRLTGEELDQALKDIGKAHAEDGAPPVGEDDTAQPAGPFERVTVYLTPASSAALIRAAETTGDSKTDTINRAIQTYALMVGEVAGGSRVLVRNPDGASAAPGGEAAS